MYHGLPTEDESSSARDDQPSSWTTEVDRQEFDALTAEDPSGFSWMSVGLGDNLYDYNQESLNSPRPMIFRPSVDNSTPDYGDPSDLAFNTSTNLAFWPNNTLAQFNTSTSSIDPQYWQDLYRNPEVSMYQDPLAVASTTSLSPSEGIRTTYNSVPSTGGLGLELLQGNGPVPLDLLTSVAPSQTLSDTYYSDTSSGIADSPRANTSDSAMDFSLETDQGDIAGPSSSVASDGFICTEPGCEKSFTRRHDRQRHIDTVHHCSNNICHVCGKNFTRQDALNRHKRIARH